VVQFNIYIFLIR